MSVSLLTPSSSEEGLGNNDIEMGEKLQMETVDALERYMSSINQRGYPGLHEQLGKGFAKHFQSMYVHLKNDFGYPLFRSIVYYQAFGGEPGPFRLFQHGDDVGGDNYSQYINRLDTILHSKHDANAWLRVCITVNSDNVSERTFGFITKLMALLRLRGDQLLRLPRYGIFLILEKNWNMNSIGNMPEYHAIIHPPEKNVDIMANSAEITPSSPPLAQEENNLTRRLKRLSRSKSSMKINISNIIFDKSEVKVKSKAVYKSHLKLRLPSAAEPIAKSVLLTASEATRYRFTWRRHPPMYHGGFDIFLWQPYARPAEGIHADVFYQNDAPIQYPLSRRVLVVAKDTAVMERCKIHLNRLWIKLTNYEIPLTPEVVAILPILALSQLAVEDTMVFLQESLDEITSLMYIGRKGPSREKFQYLCHVDDCRLLAIEGVDCTLSTLRETASVVSHPHLEVIEKDLVYVRDELAKLESEVTSKAVMVKDYLDLSMNWKISLLTTIATLYVPLSYVTSILGMQLSPNSFNLGHSGNPNKQNHGTNVDADSVARRQEPQETITISQADLSNIINNQTEVLIASGSKQYNGTVWAILSASLFAATLLLPLIGPDIFRYVVQGLYRSRAYWRIYCLVGFFVYFIMIYWALPAIFAHLYFSVWTFDLDGNLYLTDNPTYNDGNFLNLASFVISAVVMGCFCLWRLIITIRSDTVRHKSRRIKVWLGFAIVLLASYLVDAYTSYDLNWNAYLDTGFAVSTVVPWTYLAVVLVAPFIARWYKRRGKRLVKKARSFSISSIDFGRRRETR
ncbi:hypothetical protein F5884DRAFT_788097 [Xylogone sp. PMI_703]|nr:hypothetical protein F5884DRAFT_788097 [Xylogone sp. PMI_703]